MGFASIAAQIIFIFLFIVVIGSYVFMLNQHNTVVQTAMDERVAHDKLSLGTNIAVAASYNGTHVLANVTNVGSTALQPDEFDVYVDTVRFARDSSNISKTFTVDTYNQNMLDGGDVVRFEVLTDVSVGFHRIYISTPYGVAGADTFSD